MDALTHLLDLVLHLNRHLDQLVADYGVWVYVIMFVIVFCETGLVVTPFLPGDSLLFAAGAVAASGNMNILALMGVLIVAAVLGDSVNYWIGRTTGEGLQQRYPRLIRKDHLDKTHAFFERYGGKTIVIGRFVPFVRTFAPFVAGAGHMTYSTFMIYNVVGAVLWVTICSMAGYFFGNLPIVQENFTLVILAVVGLSVLPAVIEIARERWHRAPTA
jgi:membrane-associated protein